MTHTTPHRSPARHLTRLAALALALAVTAPSAVAEPMPPNPHTMSVSDSTQLDDPASACAVCHLPHLEEAEAPGWDGGEDTRGFRMYRSKTTAMERAGRPQAGSLACLSCHDGTLAFDSMTRGPSHRAGADGRSVGFDLSDDHPISLTYRAGDRDGFHPRSKVEAEGLRFFKGHGSQRDQLECGTCHDPHDVGSENFLRTTASGSLCQTCHIK